jgi:hypothetical protein
MSNQAELLVQIRDVLLEALQIIPLFVMRRYCVTAKNEWVAMNSKQSDEAYGSVGEKPMLS